MLFGRKRPKTVTIQAVEGRVPWRVYRNPDSGRWIAACDALSITVSADTEADIHDVAASAMDLLFKDLFESGELDSFLRSAGWKASEQLPRPHATVPDFRLPPIMLNRVHTTDELVSA